MNNVVLDRLLNQIISGTVRNAVNDFLLDRRAQGLSPRTIAIYTQELGYFCNFLNNQGVIDLDELTPTTIRAYMVQLATHRNPGGCHVSYRVIRTFTYWQEQETDGEWRSPIRKVKPPKLPQKIIDPIPIESITKLLSTCNDDFTGIRDRAALLFLLDTGVRAAEFVGIDLADVDMIDRSVKVRHGKGGKDRYIYFGVRTRRALRAYLKMRIDTSPALWIKQDAERVTYDTLADMLDHRIQRARVGRASAHDFRRSFAINLHRAGVDIYIIQTLMGHSDLQVLQRYLKLTTDDLKLAHRRGSPVDNLRL